MSRNRAGKYLEPEDYFCIVILGSEKQKLHSFLRQNVVLHNDKKKFTQQIYLTPVIALTYRKKILPKFIQSFQFTDVLSKIINDTDSNN